MTDIRIRKENQWTNKQLQKLLNTEHIRQHLIKVGLINRYGEIVPKEEYEHLHKRRSRRRPRSLSKTVDQQTSSMQRPLTAIHRNDSKHRHSKSPDYHSINRNYKNTTNFQSKQTNKSLLPRRVSSPNQSTRTKNTSAQRTISPKIIPINNRCLITMIYYGPQTTIDYNRSWFEPDGNEVIVMQQHCGGENLIVHKGALKPNETFQFESRRHSDYPFALTFYVNGLIDYRLSICCESRYKHNVRIGGKGGLFGIINVEKSRACRRCRYERKMKRLAELKADKHLSKRNQISTPEPNITRPTSPELTLSSNGMLERSESPILNEELIKTDLPNDVNVPEKKYSFIDSNSTLKK